MLVAPIFPFLYERVVPLPLHIFLGLGNHLVDLIKKDLDHEDHLLDFDSFMHRHKATPMNIHGAQKASGHQTLHGPEIQSLVHDPQLVFHMNRIADEAQRSFLHSLLLNYKKLIPFLLSPEPMNDDQVTDFRNLVFLLGDTWHRNKYAVKPKIHMLFHCVAFMEQHGYLGAYSESSIESAHHDVHQTFENHGSQGQNLVHKQRRMHSDIVQKRISRVESGSILLPPTPRLCPRCGVPSAKYMNNGHLHQCPPYIN